jgi:hypothetical protein
MTHSKNLPNAGSTALHFRPINMDGKRWRTKVGRCTKRMLRLVTCRIESTGYGCVLHGPSHPEKSTRYNQHLEKRHLDQSSFIKYGLTRFYFQHPTRWVHQGLLRALTIFILFVRKLLRSRSSAVIYSILSISPFSVG